MMQSADLRKLQYLPELRRLYPPKDRIILIEGKVRACPLLVFEIRLQDVAHGHRNEVEPDRRRSKRLTELENLHSLGCIPIAHKAVPSNLIVDLTSSEHVMRIERAL